MILTFSGMAHYVLHPCAPGNPKNLTKAGTRVDPKMWNFKFSVAMRYFTTVRE